MDKTTLVEESTLTALSPQETALLKHLADHGGEIDSLALRRATGIANISAAATDASRKLALAGDPRRITCVNGSVVDPTTGRRRPTARWRLTIPQLA